MIQRLKALLRPAIYRLLFPDRPTYSCPICGFAGPFKDKRISKNPDLLRVHSKCLGCGASERHRMLHLVFEEVFQSKSGNDDSVLHIAPEACLTPSLSKYFNTYHTADLLKPDVDFNEDIQKMSFADGTYDAVVVSRVLTIPPNIDASVSEIRRVLKPGGIAIIAEIYGRSATREFGKMINSRSREVGIDMLDLYRKHFSTVDSFFSDRYDAKYQLANLMKLNNSPHDDYPDEVRIAGSGFRDLVAVCHA